MWCNEQPVCFKLCCREYENETGNNGLDNELDKCVRECGRPKKRCDKHDKCKCESDVNIFTSINIVQNAEANGGEAHGGNADGGNANGGNAAAASARSLGEGDASASASVGQIAADLGEKAATDQNLTEEEALSMQSLLDLQGAVAIGGASASGGNATGGEANGGDATGGEGGEATNNATVSVENVVVIVCEENGFVPALTLGTNNRKLGIKVDENGDTYVNGQKMDEQELENGMKVLIFRNSETKKTESK